MTKQLFLIFTRSGAEWVMYALAALSVASVAVILERALFFARHGRSRSAELAPLLAAGRVDLARRAVDGAVGLEAQVVRAALDAADGGPASVAETVACAVRTAKPPYERGLGFLGTLGANAPFLGLFGTVVGIIKAFADLGVGSGRSTGAAAVMTGLSEALVATAVGIFVAIPAVVAFNAFNRRLKTIVTRAEALGHALAAHLQRDDVRGAAVERAASRRSSADAVAPASDAA